jgi:hypothetical protein
MARSPACVTKWLKRGMPVTSAGIDFEAARDWLLKNVTAYPDFGGPGVAVPIDGTAATSTGTNGHVNGSGS